MEKQQILDFLNSEQTYNEVLSILNQFVIDNNSDLNQFSDDYYIAGGSVANTIYYLLNKHKFEKPVINDIDLFYFTNVYNNSNALRESVINFSDNDNRISPDGYGRVWMFEDNQVSMLNSQRMGVINLVTMTNPFDEQVVQTKYYNALIDNFDINSCCVGLDRVNKKIVFNNDFVKFLETDLMELKEITHPLQTFFRLNKKIAELNCDDSNLDVEIELLLNVTKVFNGHYVIGRDWLEKYYKHQELFKPYFTEPKLYNDWMDHEDLYKYEIKEFKSKVDLKKFEFNSYKELVVFWDVFIRNNKKPIKELVNKLLEIEGPGMYINKDKTIVSIIFKILYKQPSYFNGEYSFDDVIKVIEFFKFVYDSELDPKIFIVSDVKTQLKFIQFIQDRFINDLGDFNYNLFYNTLSKVSFIGEHSKKFESFDYKDKIESLNKGLKNLWIYGFNGYYLQANFNFNPRKITF